MCDIASYRVPPNEFISNFISKSLILLVLVYKYHTHLHTPAYIQLCPVADTYGILFAYGIILAFIAGIIWPILIQLRFSLDVIYFIHTKEANMLRNEYDAHKNLKLHRMVINLDTTPNGAASGVARRYLRLRRYLPVRLAWWLANL